MNQHGLTMKAVAITGMLFVCACAPGKMFVYDIGLKEVARPTSARQQYGDQQVTRVATLPRAQRDTTWRGDTFEDGMLKVSWGINPDAAYFTAENKTPNAVAVLWDRAAIVMPDGTSSQVMHNGVRYSECQNAKAPSVIAPRSKLVDVVVPCSTLSSAPTVSLFATAGQTTWSSYIFDTNPTSPAVRSFIGGGDAYYPEKLGPKLDKRDRGASFRILIPFEIQGVTSEYTFTFTVDSVYVTQKVKSK